MGGLKALTLAGVFALVGGAALAADLLPPPPPPAEPPMLAPADVVDTGGWYLRGDAGAGFNNATELRSTLAPYNALGGAAPWATQTNSSMGAAALIGVGVGYQINNWFRADVTGEYRSLTPVNKQLAYTQWCPTGVCTDDYLSHHHAGLFLVNGYADLGTWGGFTPYVGAGVGFATHGWRGITDTGLGWGRSTDASKTNFAWAAMGGVAYSIAPNLKLDVGYRYVDMGKVTSNPIQCIDAASCFNETQSMRVTSHDVRVGLRYAFGGSVAPAPILAPAPLVRKY